LIDLCPGPAFWIAHQEQPGVLAGSNDCFVAIPHAHAEFVASEIILNVIQLWGVRRQGFAGCGQRLKYSLLGVERFVGDEDVSLHVQQQVIGADQVMSLAPC
jgi:hypothetical protein